MKKISIALFLGICFLNLSAQEEEVKKEQKTNDEYKTLFNKNDSPKKDRKTEIGGYGAVIPQYSRLLDQDAFFIGGRGMLLINHRIGIGTGVYVSVNKLDKQFMDTIIRLDDGTLVNNPVANLRMGYAGIYFEYIIAPNKPIHVSIPVLFGGGYAHYVNTYKIDQLFEDNKSSSDEVPKDYTYSTDSYLLIQPGLELEMNINKFFRLGLNASYRYIYDLDMLQTESDDLDGFNAAISFKFGKY